MNPPPVATREIAREERFNVVWTQELNDVFADVAPYYDRANYIASLGLWGWFLRKFMDTVDIRPGERMLDVCAGTNAIGIALLKREPTLEVHAIDRSAAMQEVGRRCAERSACASQRDPRRAHAALSRQLVRRGDAAVRGRATCASGASPRRSGACSSPAGASITPTCCGRETAPSRRSTTPICASACGSRGSCSAAGRRAQLQGVFHPGAADVLFRAGTQRPWRMPASRTWTSKTVFPHARFPSRGKAAAGLIRQKALAELHARLLREFSRRTTENLRRALPLRLALPALEPFLAENVAKEVRKDALVIQRAGEALAAGAPLGPEAARQLWPARAVDQEFSLASAHFRYASISITS